MRKIKIQRPKEWPILKEGDEVAIVSPASGSLPEELEAIAKFLASWSLVPKLYHYKKQSTEHFLANSDIERFNELKSFLENEEIKVIMAMRGGYGSARILPELLSLNNIKNNKLLTGFSDITSLHLAFNNCLGFSSLHAPVLSQIVNGKIDENSIQFFKDVLFGKVDEFIYEVSPLNKNAKEVKENTNFSKLVGGNLSLIQTSIATPWAINNCVNYSLLIEEVNEKAYKIDRMLNHLKNSEILTNCQAILIGDIVEEADQEGKYHLDYVIEKFVSEVGLPIFNIKNIGHDSKNISIPLGLDYEII